MVPKFDRVSKRLINMNANSKATLLMCSIFLLASGIGLPIGGPTCTLYPAANAQLEDPEELRKEQRAVAADKAASGSNEFALTLDRAHFIPLSPLSDSPGNQVKMLFHYTTQQPSEGIDDTISAIMEVYAANNTLLRTSSLPEPIVPDDSDGTIQLATTFDDPNLKDVTAKALLTDGQKINPLSDPIEVSVGLGEITSAGNLDE